MTRPAIILCVLTHLAQAQVKPQDLAIAHKVMQSLSDRHSKASLLSASYRQERSTILLRKPLVSRGTLAVRQAPACLVFRSDGQGAAIIRLTKDLYEVHRPALRTLERTRLTTSALSRALFQSFRPDPAEMEKSFCIQRVTRDKSELRVEYAPRDKLALRYLRSFSITFDQKTSGLRRIGYTDPQGDSVMLFLSNLQLDPKLDKATFELVTQPGTRILTHKPRRQKTEKPPPDQGKVK